MTLLHKLRERLWTSECRVFVSSLFNVVLPILLIISSAVIILIISIFIAAWGNYGILFETIIDSIG